MKALSVSVPLAATATLSLAFLVLRPFAILNECLDRAFGAPPAWTQISKFYRNAGTQELSHGEKPLPSLRALEAYWTDHETNRRICFIGNSQMMAMSLAPGEAPPSEPEKTYVDLTGDLLRENGFSRATVYRLAAPGMSYTESLWYVMYLAGRTNLRPDLIALQVNYQAFWNAGIREGMLDMLGDKEFAREVKQIAAGTQPYADSFAAAIDKAAEFARKSKVGDDLFKDSSEAPSGARLEAFVRRALFDRYPLSLRPLNKDDLMSFLYRCRLYLLRIKPSTARSITGARLWRSQAALEATAALCRTKGIKLVLFYAPLNPSVSLYRHSSDKTAYRSVVEQIARRNGLPVYDLEDSIGHPYWGRQLNSPDPLHLGRTGHKLLADKMAAIIRSELRNL